MAASPVHEGRVNVWLGVPHTPSAMLICNLSARGLRQQKEAEPITVPDCDEPLLMVIAGVAITDRSVQVVGAGVLDPDTREALQELYDSDVPQLVAFELEAANEWQGYYSGSMVLTGFDIVADRDEDYVQTELTWTAAGACQWTPAPV